MLVGERIVDGAAKESSEKLVAEWHLDVYTSTPGEMVRAQIQTGFEWF